MAAEEGYAEKIFRLTFKKSRHAKMMMPLLGDIDELIYDALKLNEEPVLIYPYPGNEDRVLQKIRKIVLERGLEQDEDFNTRLSVLDNENPRDTMVEEIEARTNYLHLVTKQMIKTTDDLLNATVDVRSPDTTIEGDSSQESDDSVEEREQITKHYENVLSKIHDILAFPAQKVLVDEETKDDMRREILSGMATGSKEYTGLLEHSFKVALDRFLAEKAAPMAERTQAAEMANEKATADFDSRGGTKRRKSKRTKRRKSKKKKTRKRRI